MSKAERLEDLGAIRILVRDLCEDEIFRKYERPKYACDIFFANSEEKQHDQIYEFACKLRAINEILREILSMAEGDEE